MLTVLLVAVVSTSAVRASLNAQYYNQLAKTAADAGIVYAKSCLESNNGIPRWTDNSPLTPATDCSGFPITGASNFVLNDTDNKIQSTFSVGCAGCNGIDKLTEIVASGTTRLLRRSDSTEWRRYNQTARLGKYEVKMGWKKISSGGNQTCAISSDNKAYCWGTGYLGGGGEVVKEKDKNGNLVPSNDPLWRQSDTPVAVQSKPDVPFGEVKSISVGLQRVCMLDIAGLAYCWGNTTIDTTGEYVVSSHYPTLVSNSLRFDSISVGDSHTCAVSAGKAYCWGANDKGQSGLAGVSSSDTPVAVTMSSGGAVFNKTVTAISAGQSHTCAITDEPTANAYCWGEGMFGRLGRGNEGDINYAVAVRSGVGDVLNGKRVTAISAGNSHTCAIAGSRVYCWGQNGAGKLGNGDASASQSLVPAAVKSTSGQNWDADVSSVAAGNSHTCAIAAGAVYCWGFNRIWDKVLPNYSFICLYGLLGAGRPEDIETTCVSEDYSAVPVLVVASGALKDKTISALTLGGTHSCAFGNGSIYCWGDNSYSQLGATTAPKMLYVDQPKDEWYKYSPVPIPTTVQSVPIYF